MVARSLYAILMFTAFGDARYLQVRRMIIVSTQHVSITLSFKRMLPESVTIDAQLSSTSSGQTIVPHNANAVRTSYTLFPIQKDFLTPSSSTDLLRNANSKDLGMELANESSYSFTSKSSVGIGAIAHYLVTLNVESI